MFWLIAELWVISLQGLYRGINYCDGQRAENEMQRNDGSLLLACPTQTIINVTVRAEGRRVLKTNKPFLMSTTSSGSREQEILSFICRRWVICQLYLFCRRWRLSPLIVSNTPANYIRCCNETKGQGWQKKLKIKSQPDNIPLCLAIWFKDGAV
jgi:hypothetical protein